VLLLLLLFFSGLTAMALGTSGVEALATRFTASQLGSANRDGDAAPLPVLQGQAAQHRSTAAGERTRTSFPSWLPLLSLPAVSAVPFPWLLRHEYAGLLLWIVRAYLARPLWHALLWWHVVCAATALALLVQWRWRWRLGAARGGHDHAAAGAGRADFETSFAGGMVSSESSAFSSSHSNEDAAFDAALPPLLRFLLHCAFWALQSLLFGWPSVFLLRQQLCAKTKRS